MFDFTYLFSKENYLIKIVDEVVLACGEFCGKSNDELRLNSFRNFIGIKYKLNKDKSIRFDVIRREIEDDLNECLSRGIVPTVEDLIFFIIKREKYGLHATSTTNEVVRRRLKEHKIL